MSRQFNKERFETIIKLVYTFLRFSVIAMYVLIGIVGIAWLTTLFLPQALFDYNLENLKNMNVQIFGFDYDLSALGLYGIVNVKQVVFTGILAALVNLLFFQYVQVLLKRIMGHITDQHPFNQENVTYLKYLGIGYLVASLVLPAINSIFFNQAINTLEIYEAGVNMSLNMQAVFMGVIVLILAYIFDYGSYLQEEHDLTV